MNLLIYKISLCYLMFVMVKKIFNFILGFVILFGFYHISLFIVKITHIVFPPAVLGLILFAVSLLLGIVKEKWVESSVNFILKYMALLFVPFLVGLTEYKNLIMHNLFAIVLVIFAATTVTIVVTGVFAEFGIKYLRLLKIRNKHD
ncbi:MAG: CidA/LrgA family protein [Candidatus Gastranaerophilaceae bacterium]